MASFWVTAARRGTASGAGAPPFAPFPIGEAVEAGQPQARPAAGHECRYRDMLGDPLQGDGDIRLGGAGLSDQALDTHRSLADGVDDQGRVEIAASGDQAETPTQRPSPGDERRGVSEDRLELLVELLRSGDLRPRHAEGMRQGLHDRPSDRAYRERARYASPVDATAARTSGRAGRSESGRIDVGNHRGVVFTSRKRRILDGERRNPGLDQHRQHHPDRGARRGLLRRVPRRAQRALRLTEWGG